MVVLNVSSIFSITYWSVGNCAHQASTCFKSTFTSFGHGKPQADWAIFAWRSKRLPHSRNPDPNPTYSSLPPNERIINFFCRASGYLITGCCCCWKPAGTACP
ncbi:hypothetical protein PHMEG_00013750 [Phytophthora megakarya]|uniref:Uncharacterized protein n=1 Tax=Phytophthora megakarya TaxID=4795 RepID=A0A225W757_9STRA|nr:hypothetical protein PHMEG_00013750 [Phytophthora megakarya]